MKKPNWTPHFVTSLILALLIASAPSRAELVSQSVREDAITPEGESEDEVVIVKKKLAPRPIPVSAQQPTIEAQAVATAQVSVPAKPSVGNSLDQGIQTKMDDVRNQFESALLKTLDRIKISVDDGVPVAAAASAQSATVQASGNNGPVNTTIVQDSLVGAQSAHDKNAYLSVEGSPSEQAAVDADFDGEGADGSSVAQDHKLSRGNKVRVGPLFGKTMINSSSYDVDSRYTAGFEIEMDVDENFSAVLGYSYSQYDIGLASGNPFYGHYQPNGFLNNNTSQLQYNQNLFTGGVRAYLMPREAKFRVFGGAGIGYNLGYLNYRQDVFNSYAFNPNTAYGGSPDYEVKSWLGLLESGATLNISRTVSIGAVFKYALVFSSSQNTSLNNYAFVNNGYGQAPTASQSIVGGTLAKDSFYSLLGSIRVSF